MGPSPKGFPLRSEMLDSGCSMSGPKGLDACRKGAGHLTRGKSGRQGNLPHPVSVTHCLTQSPSASS